MFGLGGCISTKMVVFVQSGFIRKKWLYLGKFFVFGQKLLYLGKNGCIRDKVVVFVKKWLYSVKVVLFGQKLFNSGKYRCNRVKQVVFAKVIFFGQK